MLTLKIREYAYNDKYKIEYIHFLESHGIWKELPVLITTSQAKKLTNKIVSCIEEFIKDEF